MSFLLSKALFSSNLCLSLSSVVSGRPIIIITISLNEDAFLLKGRYGDSLSHFKPCMLRGRLSWRVSAASYEFWVRLNIRPVCPNLRPDACMSAYSGYQGKISKAQSSGNLICGCWCVRFPCGGSGAAANKT